MKDMLSERGERALRSLERWLVPFGISLIVAGASLLPVGGLLVWAGVVALMMKGKLREFLRDGDLEGFLDTVRWFIWASGLFGLAYVVFMALVLVLVLVVFGVYLAAILAFLKTGFVD